jgi:hypothetical protein
MIMGILLLCGVIAKAEPVTIQISGNVTSLGGYTEVIPSSIYSGVQFSGIYTYESSAIDLDSSSQRGLYQYNSP